jgi:hypothetical protein
MAGSRAAKASGNRRVRKSSLACLYVFEHNFEGERDEVEDESCDCDVDMYEYDPSSAIVHRQRRMRSGRKNSVKSKEWIIVRNCNNGGRSEEVG